MKTFILIFITSTIISMNIGSEKCVIKPSIGVNNIVIDSSYLEDVVEEYAKSKIEKRWVKAVETEVFGRYERFIEVPDVAKFSTLSRNKKISKIVFKSPCNCKTKEGIGIGSRYYETVSVLGNPKFNYFIREGKKQNIQLIYDNMEILFDGNDTLTNVISQIIIYKTN